MAEERIVYSVDLDTADLEAKLANIRSQIDDTLNASASMGMSSAAVPGVEAFDAAAYAAPMMDISNQATQQYMQMMQSYASIPAMAAAPAIDTSSASIQEGPGFWENWRGRVRESFLFNPSQMSSPRYMDGPGGMQIVLPTDFDERSFMENVFGSTFGMGYDQRESPLTRAEYRQRSRRNLAFNIPIFDTEAVERNQMTNFFQDMSRGNAGGVLGRRDAANLARTVMNMDREDQFIGDNFSREEVSEVVNSLATQGAFLSAENPKDYADKIRQALSAMREVTREFKAFGEEAVGVFDTLRSLGYNADNIGDVAIRMGTRGTGLGLSARDMLSAAETGGQFAAGIGVDSFLGAEGAQDTLEAIRRARLGGTLDSNFIKSMGGEMGLTTYMQQSAYSFNRSGAGLFMQNNQQGIQGIGDLLRLQLMGDEEAALNPELAIARGMELAQDTFQRLTGRKANDWELSQIMPMFGLGDRQSTTAAVGTIRGVSDNPEDFAEQQMLASSDEFVTRERNAETSRYRRENLLNRASGFVEDLGRAVGRSLDGSETILDRESAMVVEVPEELGGGYVKLGDGKLRAADGTYLEKEKIGTLFSVPSKEGTEVITREEALERYGLKPNRKIGSSSGGSLGLGGENIVPDDINVPEGTTRQTQYAIDEGELSGSFSADDPFAQYNIYDETLDRMLEVPEGSGGYRSLSDNVRAGLVNEVQGNKGRLSKMWNRIRFGGPRVEVSTMDAVRAENEDFTAGSSQAADFAAFMMIANSTDKFDKPAELIDMIMEQDPSLSRDAVQQAVIGSMRAADKAIEPLTRQYSGDELDAAVTDFTENTYVNTVLESAQAIQNYGSISSKTLAEKSSVELSRLYETGQVQGQMSRMMIGMIERAGGRALPVIVDKGGPKLIELSEEANPSDR